MSNTTTFIVSGYVERHYRLEIEASSYEEAEEIAEGKLDTERLQDLWDYESGQHVIICDVECEDPEWEEEELPFAL
tara:strand:+ start:279 stop:506 length:228 start_codon:yes stop_codon:yes gene_type:complete